MKKLITILLTFSIIFQSMLPGVFSAGIAYAGTLSTSMFPSSLGGLPLYQTGTASGSACYTQAQEFVSALYYSGGTSQLGVSLSKYSSSQTAESTARNCITLVKAQYGSAVSWTPTKDTTVSGYTSIMTIASAEGLYLGALYTIVGDYLIANAYASASSISESTLKSINAALVAKLPKPVEKKNNGENCKNSEECKSGRCYNNICCSSGECCQTDEHCGELKYCDRNYFHCVSKKQKGESCGGNNECYLAYCGYASESNKKICCLKTETGLCCLAHNDCGSMNYCEDYSCLDKKSEQASCWKDYECSSGLCEEGKCKYKETEEKKKEDGESCTYHYECKSANCINSICCQKDKDCCRTDDDCQYLGQFQKCQNYYCVEDTEAKEAHEQEEGEAAERYRRGTDGECAPDEECTTQDCMATARCTIEEACEWGGTDARTAVGCIAAIAADLNIVAKIADILQNVGCGVIGNFVVGILTLNIDKVTDALINIVYTAYSIVKLKVGTIAKFIFNVIVCIDNYFGISKKSIWFFISLCQTVVNVISAVTQQAASAVSLESPATLMVTDSQGRQVGIDEQGNLHEDIPGGLYIEFSNADIKMVVLLDTKGEDFDVETYGEKSGEIDVKIARCDKGEKEVIEYNDVIQDKGTKIEVSFTSKVGEAAKPMAVVSAKGEREFEAPDKVMKEKIEVPREFIARGFWWKLKNKLVYILLAIGIALIAAGAYIKLKRRKD